MTLLLFFVESILVFRFGMWYNGENRTQSFRRMNQFERGNSFEQEIGRAHV